MAARLVCVVALTTGRQGDSAGGVSPGSAPLSFTTLIRIVLSMNFSDVLTVLNEASAFELFRLRAAISVALDEPARVRAIQARLTLGQSIEYFDARANTLRCGTIRELRRKTVLIIDRDDGKRWLIDYPSINLNGADVQIRQPAPRGLNRHEIAVGDVVGYLDRNGLERSGRVTRRNDKTVSMVVGDQQWRVDYSLLHRVMEADIVEVGGMAEIECMAAVN
ncbi:hypothetical protein ACFOLJ_05730 [Rugamonas sp. CCM 8940]|uniref:hypothetical protein n=1 Tax=Rugamonas sp. CCM 8940 TaxID=2765359 RepID=UPI0018F5A35C|nr:hypothetical protein [Rugamonas sp. CCM 8940]MBJ7312776.1 hypothetical protein [Rugamonas sp. CCM 8940]